MENSAGLVSCCNEKNILISKAQHQRITQNMHDVPEEPPAVKIPLSEVGISAKTVWVRLRQGCFPFEADISVNLPASFRGIHMSRIEGVISGLYNQEFEDIGCYSKQLACEILRLQRGDVATIFLTGKLPFTTQTCVSQRLSLDSVTVFVRTTATKSHENIHMVTQKGMELAHITACPCTQVYLQDVGQEQESGRSLPYPTHSQRSLTRLLIEDRLENIGFDDLLKCLKGGLHVVQDLLKRPDEAELVLKSHLKPQFAEDAVRDVAAQVLSSFSDKLAPDAMIEIESLSLESIHLHNVRCKLTVLFSELLNGK